LISNCPTYWVKIYIAGPIKVAKQIIRRECKAEGLCVTIDPTTFIYTGGEETGYVVQLINYPKYPVSNFVTQNRATKLALMLKSETFQDSVLIMDSVGTQWTTDRL